VLHSILIMANVFCSINPSFFSLSLLDIIDPLSLISASVHMSINSEYACLVSFEFSNINITFCMPKCSFSFSFIFYPVAFIYSSICPYLNPITTSFFYSFLFINHHLTFIHTSIRKNVIWNEY
jgi:hypothetical protein